VTKESLGDDQINNTHFSRILQHYQKNNTDLFFNGELLLFMYVGNFKSSGAVLCKVLTCGFGKRQSLPAEIPVWAPQRQ